MWRFVAGPHDLAQEARFGVHVWLAFSTIVRWAQPELIHTRGLSVAFLSYASVFPFGYEAAKPRPLLPLHKESRLTAFA